MILKQDKYAAAIYCRLSAGDGFSGNNAANCESVVQVMVALNAPDISEGKRMNSPAPSLKSWNG